MQTVELNLRDIQDLNQMKSMLKSNDLETMQLGYDMFKAHRITQTFYGMTIKINEKEIPVSWYFRKADKEKEDQKDKLVYEQTWPELILRVLTAIQESSNCFRTGVVIRFNYQDMEDNTQEGMHIPEIGF